MSGAKIIKKIAFKILNDNRVNINYVMKDTLLL